MAIISLLRYCDYNWNPHPENLDINEFFKNKWPSDININEKMQRDSEPLQTNIRHAELLYFSDQIFSTLSGIEPTYVSIPLPI